MNDPTFYAAYERVREKYSEREWIKLNQHDLTDEIYREMRRIDAESGAVTHLAGSEERLASSAQT